MKLALFLLAVVLLVKLTRCIIFNFHNICIYTVLDLWRYIRHKKWRDFNEFGIRLYMGMFGCGKTLSMTKKATALHRRFGDTLLFISNYHLTNIPYVPLKNFNQLVDLGLDLADGKQGIVVLIDEISATLSHRNYANFPLEMLNTLLQQRKKRILILCTAQRFFMVDKIFRSITHYAIDCRKYWRLQHLTVYDAWELENAINPRLIQRVSHSWSFVFDRDYAQYDTYEMISRNKVKDFISNDEKLAKLGLDNVVNEMAINKPSRQLKRMMKK
jgi:hypothetical protein